MIMAKNVVCKKCNNLVNDWCEKVKNSIGFMCLPIETTLKNEMEAKEE